MEEEGERMREEERLSGNEKEVKRIDRADNERGKKGELAKGRNGGKENGKGERGRKSGKGK